MQLYENKNTILENISPRYAVSTITDANEKRKIRSFHHQKR